MEYLSRGAGTDNGNAITLDSAGNIYIAGTSNTTWGTTIKSAYTAEMDIVVAKLSPTGTLLYNSFHGAVLNDFSSDIIRDSSNNTYVLGTREFSGTDPDAIIYKINADFSSSFYAIMGSLTADYGNSIAQLNDGKLVVTGHSDATWGISPLSAHSGGDDVFVAQLSEDLGTVHWHRFMGSSDPDYAGGVTTDDVGNIYAGGYSQSTWGSPTNPHSTGDDGFVAKITNSGNLVWNTFLGAPNGGISVFAVSLTKMGLYAGGRSDKTWGKPQKTHAGDLDAFIARLDTSNGALSWNTFMGSTSFEANYAFAMTASKTGNIFVTADSGANWGANPVNANSGGWEAFVAKFVPPCTYFVIPAAPSSTIICL